MTEYFLAENFAEQLRLREGIHALETPVQAEQQRLHLNKVELLLKIMRQTNADGNRTMLPVPRSDWRIAAIGDKRPQRWVPFVRTMQAIWHELSYSYAVQTREEWQHRLMEVAAKSEKDEQRTKAFVLVKEDELRQALEAVPGHEPMHRRFNFMTLKMGDEEWPFIRQFKHDKFEGWGVYFRPFHQTCERDCYFWMMDDLEEAQLVAMEISIRIQGARSCGIRYKIPSGYHTLPRYISVEDLFFNL